MIPQFPKFKKITRADKKEVEKFTRDFPPYSDFNFTSMYTWNTRGKMALSRLHGNLVVRFIDYLSGEPFYSFLGNEKVADTIHALAEYSEREGLGLKLKLVPEEIHHLHKEDFIFIHDEDNSDYIYHINDTASHKGKKYETQRNLANRFKRSTPEAKVHFFDLLAPIKDHVIALDKKWKKNKGQKILEREFKNESKALLRIFHLPEANSFVTTIYHHRTLIAFCINELLPDSPYAISHYCKADVSYPGIYSYLLKENCRGLKERNKEYLNFEQDLGLPELRFSKASYRPVKFLKKFTLIKE